LGDLIERNIKGKDMSANPEAVRLQEARKATTLKPQKTGTGEKPMAREYAKAKG
jgi:hypothetical protein